MQKSSVLNIWQEIAVIVNCSLYGLYIAQESMESDIPLQVVH